MNKTGEDLILTGAWFLLVGTVTSAVGISCKPFLGNNFGKGLFAKGNAIEAFGNSLQAVGKEKVLTKENSVHQLKILFGSWIQAAGNATNTFATNLELSGLEVEGQKLNAVGSAIQSIGASFEVSGAIEETSKLAKFEAYGNELIALGALIDGIANVALLNEKDLLGDQLLIFGCWVQVFGSILIVYALTNNFEEEKEFHHYVYQYGNLSTDAFEI